MAVGKIDGCFYLDSCVILAEILMEYQSRMDKFRKDVLSYAIPCYVSASVQKECEEKLEKNTNFVGDTFKKMTEAYLEGIKAQRKSLSSPPTYEDIRILEDMFILLYQNLKPLDILQSPLQVIEEWVVQFLEREISRPTALSLQVFINRMIGLYLMKMTNIATAYEQLVVYEQKYVKRSTATPEKNDIDSLAGVGIHSPDADHIASAAKHKKDTGKETAFLTFDYKSIIQMKYEVQKLIEITCCDPIYGINHLRLIS